MSNPVPTLPRRVLIASSHGLFGQGLRSLLLERKDAGVEVVGIAHNLDEALEALEKLRPDLIIVDYDDEVLNRDEFLARFVEGQHKLRVVLLSLQSGKEAVVYDRRTLAASQIDTWLEEWNTSDEIGKPNLNPLPARAGAQIDPNQRRNGMKHFVIAGILVLVVTGLLIVGLNYVQLLPVQASAQAMPIDSLFHLEFQVIAFLFSLIVVLIGYSIVVFRRKKGDTTDAKHIEGNYRLELVWTIAPLITVMFFAYLGGQSLAETMKPAPRPLEIKVVGQQWAWRFEYPEQGIITTTLMLPVNRQALLHLTSVDVIHSFWVPEFRVKQDALPGENLVRDLRVTPIKLGNYTLRCAELCGLNHTKMEAPVKVLTEGAFNNWVNAATAVSNDPIARGKKAAAQFGCVACHSANGTKLVGPTWKGLGGSQVELNDGTKVVADDAYLEESIRNPNAKIVSGFLPNVMPASLAGQMTDAQIKDLIAYMNSLK
jgi:cytochrome c oxidase subunit 2